MTKNRLIEMIRRVIIEESSQNWIQQQIVEDSAWSELAEQMNSEDLMTLGRLLELLDVKIDNSGKNIDGGDFYEENLSELDFLFPIDTAKDFIKYLDRYIEIVDENLKRPPLKLTNAIDKILIKYRNKIK